MKTEQLPTDFFNRANIPGNHFRKVLLQLLKSRAREQDNRANNHLLKELVLNYASTGKKLAALIKKMNEFLGMAAHDLRSPLVSIRGFSEILLAEDMGPLNEEQKEFIAIIHRASENMLNLVNELLDIAVIQSGELRLQLIPKSLRDLVEERIRINKIVAERKGISFHADLPQVPDSLFDPNRISQVLDNLFSNAIKFSPPDSPIHVKLTQERRALKLSVQDKGPGIPPEEQEKLFGTFQKLSARPTAGEQSIGLGLAIVKKIIEAHRGSLQVESQVGVGSTFSFRLPVGEEP